MSPLLKALIVSALTLPLVAFVAGMLVSPDDPDPDRSRPVIIGNVSEDDEPVSGPTLRPEDPGPTSRPDRGGDDPPPPAEEPGEPYTVVTPPPRDLDDDDAGDRGEDDDDDDDDRTDDRTDD